MQFEFTYLFGAVCPGKDKAIGLVIGEVGIEAMKVHLKMISDQTEPDRIAIVVLDRASWHKSQKINCFKNIILVPLPAGSPELNPVEQLWEHLRDRHLANRSFEDTEDIVEACCNAWNAFIGLAGSITSLCSRSWAIL